MQANENDAKASVKCLDCRFADPGTGTIMGEPYAWCIRSRNPDEWFTVGPNHGCEHGEKRN